METEKLIDMIKSAIESDYYESLLKRGEDPASFDIKEQDSEELQELSSLKFDMHFFGTTLLSLAMSLKEVEAQSNQELLNKAFICAGKVIELAIKNGKTDNYDNFLRILSSASFQLGKSIDEVSIINEIEEIKSSSPFERVLLHLLMGTPKQLDGFIDEWRINASDKNLCEKLDSWNRERTEYREEDYTEQDDLNFLDELLEHAITDKFCSGIKFYLEFVNTENELFCEIAKGELQETLEQTEKLDFVNLWWYTRLSLHLIDVIPRKN